MKRSVTLACCVMVACLPALAAPQKAPTEKAMTDQQFVNMAAQTDMVEANLGQMAGNAATSQEVKDFATARVTDNTADYQKLSNAAKQSDLTEPTAIDTAHNKTVIDPFEKLKGSTFDHRYAQEMITGETKSLAMYKKEAASAQNQAIRTYAQAAIPELEKNLADARDLEKAKPAK